MKKALATAKQRGFTLIELIVTIVIVGILAGIAIVGYTGVTEDAQKKADEASAEINARRVAMHMALNDTAMTEEAFITAKDAIEGDLEGQFAEGTPGDGVVTYRPSGVTDDSRDVSVTIADFGIGGGSDDGSSGSSGPYVVSGSYSEPSNYPNPKTYRWTVERTGSYTFTITGVIEGVTLRSNLYDDGQGHIAAGHVEPVYGSWSTMFFYPDDGSVELYTNADGHAEWTLAVTMEEWTSTYFSWQEPLADSEVDTEKVWLINTPPSWTDWNTYENFTFRTHPYGLTFGELLAEPLVIPAWEG